MNDEAELLPATRLRQGYGAASTGRRSVGAISRDFEDA